MRPEPNRRQNAGFALILAILALLVLGALAVYLSGLFANRNMALAFDVQGAQAVQAARAGIEWGKYNSLRGGAGACPATNITFPGTSLAQFTATVTCARVSPIEDGAVINVDTITATACNQPTAVGACPNAAAADGYVERQFVAIVSNP